MSKMRKYGLPALLALLLATLLASCDETNKVPYITRLDVQPTCGVAPLEVEYYAVATGGDEFKDPTGANLYLEMSWDFGDGHQASGSSLVHHVYEQPGPYLVHVYVKDKDGDTNGNADTLTVRVKSDTLRVWAESDPAETIAAGDTMAFNVMAEACGFDPETGDYNLFLYRWTIDGPSPSTYTGRNPLHTFTAADVGQRQVVVRVTNPGLDIVRRDTLQITVTEPPAR
jgi:PKD repeat protein